MKGEGYPTPVDQKFLFNFSSHNMQKKKKKPSMPKVRWRGSSPPSGRGSGRPVCTSIRHSSSTRASDRTCVFEFLQSSFPIEPRSGNVSLSESNSTSDIFPLAKVICQKAFRHSSSFGAFVCSCTYRSCCSVHYPHLFLQYP